MKLSNVTVSKDNISMIFDALGDVENYKTTLYLHKSEIEFLDENEYLGQLKVNLDQDEKEDKMVCLTLNKEYGSFVLTFLNADFSTAENAYNTFFVYYGLEGLCDIDRIKKKYSVEYAARYVSTKKFLDYYNKCFELVQSKYIEFQKNMRCAVDFVFNLHENKSGINLDKYSKFLAYSCYRDLVKESYADIRLAVLANSPSDASQSVSLHKIEKLAHDIANSKESLCVSYLYESSSHFALAYIALNDLIQNSKRNVSVCQNCGRYYLQYSGKEVYCELPNLDGSPTCKSYASRKAYDSKVTEDIGELTYKREYQRRVTQVYRANKEEKTELKLDFKAWKEKARKKLKQYRDKEISKNQFCEWIENNK